MATLINPSAAKQRIIDSIYDGINLPKMLLITLTSQAEAFVFTIAKYKLFLKFAVNFENSSTPFFKNHILYCAKTYLQFRDIPSKQADLFS